MAPDAELDVARNAILESYVAAEMARARRSGADFCVMMLDIEDTEGGAPDARLKLGRALSTHCRAIDVWLNDRKGAWVLLPGTTGKGALSLASRIQQTLGAQTHLFAGIADACEVRLLSPASLVTAAGRVLEHVREVGGDSCFVTAPAGGAPAKDSVAGVVNADRFETPTDWIERLFSCPVTGTKALCSFQRETSGWTVRACSARTESCGQKCADYLRQGVSPGVSWSAEHAEPAGT